MTDERSKKLKTLRDKVASYPDFPRSGILFRDIFSVLRDPYASTCLLELLNEEAKKLGNISVVVGLESRGFLFGLSIAQNLGVGFVPVRKRGKLPGKLKQVSFTLEYGSDVFEIQEESISKGQKVLIIDDLLATGGTLAASCQLIKELGAEVAQCLVIMELVDLKGRNKVDAPIISLLQF